MARTHGETGSDGHPPGARDRIKLIGAILALATLILFLAQNWQEVDIHFLWFDWSTRMMWALLAAAVVGGVAVVLFATVNQGRRGG